MECVGCVFVCMLCSVCVCSMCVVCVWCVVMGLRNGAEDRPKEYVLRSAKVNIY